MTKPEYKDMPIVKVCCGYMDDEKGVIQCDNILDDEYYDRELLEVEAILGIIQLSHGLCEECLKKW